MALAAFDTFVCVEFTNATTFCCLDRLAMQHLGLIVKNQNTANFLLQHFGSLDQLARASVQELSRFLSPAKASRVVSALRSGAVALR